MCYKYRKYLPNIVKDKALASAASKVPHRFRNSVLEAVGSRIIENEHLISEILASTEKFLYFNVPKSHTTHH